jgi:NADH:ubiquinone oxidoreductase subunit E
MNKESSPRRGNRSPYLPKGRQIEQSALDDIRQLLGDRPRQRDLLIKHLHLIQDRYRHVSAAHLVALAEEMGLAMTEVYEVATFYHHFDVVKEGETAPAKLTVRVSDGIACEMRGAKRLIEELASRYGAGSTATHGDKCSGTNHILPTKRAGRHSSGLNAHKFMKILTYQGLDAQANETFSAVGSRISRAEGMEGHSRACDWRLRKYFPQRAWEFEVTEQKRFER